VRVGRFRAATQLRCVAAAARNRLPVILFVTSTKKERLTATWLEHPRERAEWCGLDLFENPVFGPNHRPVAARDCFKESTAAPRRDQLAGRTDAVDHHTVTHRVECRFDYCPAQGTYKRVSVFSSGQSLCRSLWSPFFPPRHTKASRLGGVADSKNYETRFWRPAANRLPVKDPHFLHSKRSIACYCNRVDCRCSLPGMLRPNLLARPKGHRRG
jgi:hypothetical protein